MVIKWRNKYSGEEGFVKTVRSNDRCFENTFNYNEARRYASASVAKGIITKLVSYGEAETNDFFIVE